MSNLKELIEALPNLGRTHFNHKKLKSRLKDKSIYQYNKPLLRKLYRSKSQKKTLSKIGGGLKTPSKNGWVPKNTPFKTCKSALKNQRYKIVKYDKKQNVYLCKNLMDHHSQMMGTPFPAMAVENMVIQKWQLSDTKKMIAPFLSNSNQKIKRRSSRLRKYGKLTGGSNLNDNSNIKISDNPSIKISENPSSDTNEKKWYFENYYFDNRKFYNQKVVTPFMEMLFALLVNYKINTTTEVKISIGTSSMISKSDNNHEQILVNLGYFSNKNLNFDKLRDNKGRGRSCLKFFEKYFDGDTWKFKPELTDDLVSKFEEWTTENS